MGDDHGRLRVECSRFVDQTCRRGWIRAENRTGGTRFLYNIGLGGSWCGSHTHSLFGPACSNPGPGVFTIGRATAIYASNRCLVSKGQCGNSGRYRSDQPDCPAPTTTPGCDSGRITAGKCCGHTRRGVATTRPTRVLWFRADGRMSCDELRGHLKDSLHCCWLTNTDAHPVAEVSHSKGLCHTGVFEFGG